MNEQLRIGEQAFYRQVGGPDVLIPKDAGVSVILRLINTQIRETVRTNPNRLDPATKGIVTSIDAFYQVHSNRKFSPKPTHGEAHTAREYFNRSGIPQEELRKIRQELDEKFHPLTEKGGFLAKLAERVLREQEAARLASRLVALKTQTIFKSE